MRHTLFSVQPFAVRVRGSGVATFAVITFAYSIQRRDEVIIAGYRQTEETVYTYQNVDDYRSVLSGFGANYRARELFDGGLYTGRLRRSVRRGSDVFKFICATGFCRERKFIIFRNTSFSRGGYT